MSNNDSHTSLTGSAEPDLVEAVLDTLDGLYRAAENVSDEDQTYFSLAVSEIITNVVTHSESDSNVTVTTNLSVDREALRAQIRDNAEPAHVPLDDAGLPDEMAESGRGLVIAKMALDQFSHELDDGNIWTLARYRRNSG
ncbi:ATP-binding protein [Nesterenkonia sp. CF4.4]|uniref:ATP-binding protein n=1 Tax=Nesterenkonia sp. CF4.4 TaxID=3373079 RepID=UPI003EE599C0